ncbi:MAG: DUF971 domain-containing protein [Nitriliruptorales bacterium]|nr:DUF971 domain-containing protein [Nitriliruptorales bacterium]
MQDQGCAEPVRVDVDRDDAITTTWGDGHTTRVDLALLRERCPCAQCQALRDAGEAVWSGDAQSLRVTGAELVGAWGLGLAWSDGHATGVYEWGLLRSWCACPDCSAR